MREKVQRTANNYVVARQLSYETTRRRNSRGKSKKDGSAKISTPIWRVLHAMNELLEAWNEARDDAELREILDRYGDAYRAHPIPINHQTLGEAIGDLSFHSIFLRGYLKAPGKSDPLANLVGNLAQIYSLATGKRPAVSMPRDGSDKIPAFVEFVRGIDAAAPEPARRARSARRDGHDNAGAWSQAVRRALNEYNKRGNLPPSVSRETPTDI
jgi:hypothetical protein